MAGAMGHTCGLINPAPGAENAEPVLLIPVGLPCLKRGRLLQRKDECEGVECVTKLKTHFRRCKNNCANLSHLESLELTTRGHLLFSSSSPPFSSDLTTPQSTYNRAISSGFFSAWSTSTYTSIEVDEVTTALLLLCRLQRPCLSLSPWVWE